MATVRHSMRCAEGRVMELRRKKLLYVSKLSPDRQGVKWVYFRLGLLLALCERRW